MLETQHDVKWFKGYKYFCKTVNICWVARKHALNLYFAFIWENQITSEQSSFPEKQYFYALPHNHLRQLFSTKQNFHKKD